MGIVVDDDRFVREALVDLFGSMSMAVRAFGSVEEFFRFRRPDVPACLLLDVRLPRALPSRFGFSEAVVVRERAPALRTTGGAEVGDRGGLRPRQSRRRRRSAAAMSMSRISPEGARATCRAGFRRDGSRRPRGVCRSAR